MRLLRYARNDSQGYFFEAVQESFDTKARNTLAAFEKELTKSNLPQTVLDRHKEFVAEYGKNYEKLNSLYNAISGRRSDLLKNRKGAISKDKLDRDSNARSEIRASIKELKEFLEKWDVDGKEPPKNEGTEAPKPWRNVYMKKREPRMGGTEKSAHLLSKKDAIYAPTAADTTQTVDTEMSPELSILASNLNHDPIAIYEWVLNNIYFQPYFGSAKGVAKTYYDRAGNDFDTASLLIGLLRQIGVPCHYVYGTVRLTGEQLNNMFGTSSAVAGARILTIGGTSGRWNGFDLLVEHCWVEIYIPYNIYCGTADLPGGDTWVPLDPAFKTYSYTPAINVATAAIPTMDDWTLFWKDFFENGITDKTAVDFYKEKIADYVAANYPDKTIDDGQIKRTIVPENLGAFPISLPYNVESIHAEYPEIEDVLRHKVRFKVLSSEADMPFDAVTTFDVTFPTVSIYTKRTTVEWIGATDEEQATIDSFGGLFTTPSYLVNVKPVFMLNGEIRATGDAISVGTDAWLRRYVILYAGVILEGTGNEWERIYQIFKFKIVAGEPTGVGNNFQGYSDE